MDCPEWQGHRFFEFRFFVFYRALTPDKNINIGKFWKTVTPNDFLVKVRKRLWLCFIKDCIWTVDDFLHVSLRCHTTIHHPDLQHINVTTSTISTLAVSPTNQISFTLIAFERRQESQKHISEHSYYARTSMQRCTWIAGKLYPSPKTWTLSLSFSKAQPTKNKHLSQAHRRKLGKHC